MQSRRPPAEPKRRKALAPIVEKGLHEGIEFAKVGDVSLTLDVFVPEGDGPFPCCILVHGGGFLRGDKQTYITALFEPLSKAGFVWFTIDYRLAPKHRWPACAEDIDAAIRWVKAHAKDYKVDPRRMALIGESAGGPRRPLGFLRRRAGLRGDAPRGGRPHLCAA